MFILNKLKIINKSIKHSYPVGSSETTREIPDQILYLKVKI